MSMKVSIHFARGGLFFREGALALLSASKTWQKRFILDKGGAENIELIFVSQRILTFS